MALFRLSRPRRFHYEPRHATYPSARQHAPDEPRIRLQALRRRPPASPNSHARWLLLILIVAGLGYGALRHLYGVRAVRWEKLRVEEVR